MSHTKSSVATITMTKHSIVVCKTRFQVSNVTTVAVGFILLESLSPSRKTNVLSTKAYCRGRPRP